MRAIMVLCLAWAVVICATPSLADHFQSQSIATTNDTGNEGAIVRPVTNQVACRSSHRPIISARFDLTAQPVVDRELDGRQISAAYTSYCD